MGTVVGVVGVVAMVLCVISWLSKASPGPARSAAMAVPVPAVRVRFGPSAGRVLAGTLLCGVLYNLFAWCFLAYLQNHPPFWVRNWELTVFLHIGVLAILGVLCMPRGYKDGSLSGVAGALEKLLVGGVGITLLGWMFLSVVVLAQDERWKFFWDI